MPTLSPRASFYTAAVVAGLALWASAAPTVVYPLYAEEWDLTPTVTTAIFAAYPVVLVTVLVVFGNLSDFIGRRAAILIGLAALALGSAIFGLAPNLGWVFAGRTLMGIGVGLSLSPATAAMLEFGGPSRAHRASSTTTAATATGIAFATLLGGALVQYAPQPLHLSFWVLVFATVVTGALALFFPRQLPDENMARWRPRALRVPRGARREFVAGALGISAAFSVGAVFLALGAQIARELIGSDNVFVDGAVLSISAVTIGIVAILSRRLAPRVALIAGPPALALGLAAVLASAVTNSLVLFVLASVLSGTGYSLMFSGGLGTVSSTASAHDRGAVISAAYVIGYLIQAVSTLGLGALATHLGLLTALEIGAPILVALGAASLLLAKAPGRRDAAFA